MRMNVSPLVTIGGELKHLLDPPKIEITSDDSPQKKKKTPKHSNFENKVNLGFSIARIQKIKIKIITEFLYMVEVGTQKV
jgi:hypothetical protein